MGGEGQQQGSRQAGETVAHADPPQARRKREVYAYSSPAQEAGKAAWRWPGGKPLSAPVSRRRLGKVRTDPSSFQPGPATRREVHLAPFFLLPASVRNAAPRECATYFCRLGW